MTQFDPSTSQHPSIQHFQQSLQGGTQALPTSQGQLPHSVVAQNQQQQQSQYQLNGPGWSGLSSQNNYDPQTLGQQFPQIQQGQLNQTVPTFDQSAPGAENNQLPGNYQQGTGYGVFGPNNGQPKLRNDQFNQQSHHPMS
jgi:hypothetical protein